MHDNEAQPGAPARRWLLAFTMGIVAAYLLLFVFYLRSTGPADADQFLVFHSLQYWNAQMFGLAKQWSPLMCSGLSLAGEPQVPFMSLSMLLSYGIGPFWGLKLAIFIYFVAGWVGAWLYASLWLRLPLQRALAASLFIGNGFFICRLGYGHIDFVPFLILPLMLWLLHKVVDWWRERPRHRALLRALGCALAMGAALAMAVDGSPVAIIHLLFWIALYALVLSLAVRSPVPALVLVAAVALAALLDAGYLWPMINSQASFPRRTADAFTSALSLIWFAVLPVRGKLLPANGNGHELSVYIGPVLTFLIWRYRSGLRASLPKVMLQPLLVVSIASIVLGMGSLASLHVPVWFSPFDLLRPLPGFRSIGVTGRYWGFLALPLSLLAAAALWRFAIDTQDARKLGRWLGLALLLQLGFQTETVWAHWTHTRHYRAKAAENAYRKGPQQIEYVANGHRFQGEFITPTRAAINCYDMDEFIRAPIDSGTHLIRKVRQRGKVLALGAAANAAFVSWSHIRVQFDRGTAAELLHGVDPDDPVKIIFNQAFHPLWQADGCAVEIGLHGSLVLECSPSRLSEGPVELRFNDTTSVLAARVSQQAWTAWFLAVATLGIMVITVWLRRRWRLRIHRGPPMPVPVAERDDSR